MYWLSGRTKYCVLCAVPQAASQGGGNREEAHYRLPFDRVFAAAVENQRVGFFFQSINHGLNVF